jgi:predicted dehydrogenase
MAPTERKAAPSPNPLPPADRVGFAVVGLGHIALEQVLPGFAQSLRGKLVALVSGSPDKASAIARQHGIEAKNIYSYKTFDALRDNPDVQVVYIALPNGLHAEYTIRAARAGKHVLCEKPMAISVREGEQMIAACRAAGRKLMIAYRMQYEPLNREAIRLARAGELGDLKLFVADNGQNVGDPTQWRLRRALSGGGSLVDVGIYCFNAARFVTGEEPIEVSARTQSTPNDPRFREVEETMSFDLRFPGGVLASCTCSYGQFRLQRYTVAGTKGWAELNPAFPYQGLRMRVARASGAWQHVTDQSTDEKSQFAREIDHMAECVTTNRTPHTPGEEGLQDLRLIEQLYAAAQAGHPIALRPTSGLDAYRGPAPTADAE